MSTDTPNIQPSTAPADIHPIDQLEAVMPQVTAVVDRIAGMQMNDPTPCADFTVHGVLNHMFVGGGTFAHLFRGEEPPEVTPPAVYGWVPAAEFREAMSDLVDATRSPGALERNIPTPVGEMPGETFARFVAVDALIHGWDLARATGQPYDPPEELVQVIDRFARAAITPEVRATGMFGDPVGAPPDASTLERLVAFSGRTP